MATIFYEYRQVIFSAFGKMNELILKGHIWTTYHIGENVEKNGMRAAIAYKQVSNYLGDWVLYPLIMIKGNLVLVVLTNALGISLQTPGQNSPVNFLEKIGGLFVGWLICVAISVVWSWGEIRGYDALKLDCLGIELVKVYISTRKRWLKLKFGNGTVSRLLLEKRYLDFVIASCKYDPFTTLVYMRDGQFNGMRKREWKIFFASIIVSNLWWGIIMLLGIEFFSLADEKVAIERVTLILLVLWGRV